jgi:hypothetical protein
MPFDFIEDPELKQKATDEFNAGLESVKTETMKLVQIEVEKATSGLKASQQKLLDEKKKLQDKYKDINDPEEALRALQLITGNEEVRLLAEGKFDEVVQRRLSSATAQFEEQITELKTKYDSSEMTRTKYQSLYNDLVIDNSLRQAATKAGILPAAMEDVLNKGRQLFGVGEDERTVEARDANGKLRKTEDEKILTPDNWIESLKRTSPHYWPASRSAEFMPGPGGGDDLEMQIQAAAKAGNQKLFRELREKQKKIATSN